MTKLLHLKHWQLFLLLFGLPFLFEVIAALSVIFNPGLKAILVVFPFLVLLFAGVYFAWLYELGMQLHKKLPDTVPMNLTRFKVFFFLPVVYLLAFMVFISITISYPENIQEPSTALIALIIPLHLFAMFCIFYCLYFIAKELKSVEWKRPVTFNDFAGEFFLIWYYPIGVWFIQPRINKLFDNGVQTDINLYSQPS